MNWQTPLFRETLIKVPIVFFPQPFDVTPFFHSFLIVTVLFLRLDIILISGIDKTIFFYLTANCIMFNNASLNLNNHPYKANAINYILHTSLFSAMINLYNRENIDPRFAHGWTHFIFLCQVFLKQSCLWLTVFYLLAEL